MGELAVRVRLRVRGREGKQVELVVLVNGGAESPRPLIALDPEAASRICYKGLEGSERCEVFETSSQGVYSVSPQAAVLEPLFQSFLIISAFTAFSAAC